MMAELMKVVVKSKDGNYAPLDDVREIKLHGDQQSTVELICASGRWLFFSPIYIQVTKQ